MNKWGIVKAYMPFVELFLKHYVRVCSHKYSVVPYTSTIFVGPGSQLVGDIHIQTELLWIQFVVAVAVSQVGIYQWEIFISDSNTTFSVPADTNYLSNTADTKDRSDTYLEVS